MLEVLSWFMMFVVTHFLDCFIFNKVMGKKKFHISVKMIILILLFSIIDGYIGNTFGAGIRMITTNINTVMLLKIIYNESIVKTIMFAVVSYVMYAISSIFSAIVVVGVLKFSEESLMGTGYEMHLSNAIIYMIYVAIFYQNKILQIIRKTMNWYKENKLINTVILSLIAFTYLYVIGFSLLSKANEQELTVIFLIFFICSVVFVSGFFKEKSSNNELQTKYEAMNDYLKAYERMLAVKSKSQHEYKNQLIIIQGEVYKRNKKLINYIDELLSKEKEDKNYECIKRLKNIPDGGLKGLLYYKIDKMMSEKIEVYVQVSNKLSKKSIWKNIEKDLRDLSMSLGVYIDNAIEASMEAKKKYIVLDIQYEEEKIIFEICNTYKEEIEEMGKSGYTTKGIGRGQGLTLAKEIIDRNEKLREEREISGEYYIQRVVYDPK